MNAAEHLYSFLNKPRGQLTVHLEGTGASARLVVWVRQGYPTTNIPTIFDGIPVDIQPMPTFNAQPSSFAHC